MSGVLISRPGPPSKRVKKSKNVAASHPPTSVMVNNAIKNLKDRGGSSLQAIKKYVSSAYKVDGEKVAPFIKKYLKKAADEGKLTRTKGKGASGSFKIQSVRSAGTTAPEKPRSVVKLVKPKAPKKVSSVNRKTPKKKSTKKKNITKKALKAKKTQKKITVKA